MHGHLARIVVAQVFDFESALQVFEEAFNEPAQLVDSHHFPDLGGRVDGQGGV